MSIRALHPGGSITLPSPKPVPAELGAQHHRGLTVTHADTEAICSGAQQVIAHGSGKNGGWRTATASVNRRRVRQLDGANLLHGGSRNLPFGEICRNTRVASPSINSGGRSCQHRSQNAVTLAFVGATAVVANRNSCTPPARHRRHLQPSLV